MLEAERRFYLNYCRIKSEGLGGWGVPVLASFLLSAAFLKPHSNTGSAVCTSPVAAKGDVVAVSMYGGRGAVVPYAFTGDQHGAHAVSIRGSGTGRITLVLTAYESTVWDLTAIAGRVAAVVAHGQFPQAVAGLPESVPVSFVSREASDGSPDPCFIKHAYDYVGEVEEQAEQITAALGRHPSRWFGKFAPTSFDIDGGKNFAPPRSPSIKLLRAGVEIKPVGLMPGNDGLEQMIAAGLLRRFSKKDVYDWVAKGARLSTDDRFVILASRDGGRNPLDELGTVSSGYLVLKSLDRVPVGLGGANAVTFVLPAGLTMPPAGHSTIYRLTDYPGGIPRAAREVPIDDRAGRMAEEAEKFDPESFSIVWDASGNIVRAIGIDDAGAPATRTGGAIFKTKWSLTAVIVFLGIFCIALWRLAKAAKRRLRAASVTDKRQTVSPTQILRRLLSDAVDFGGEEDTIAVLTRAQRVLECLTTESAFDADLSDEISAIVNRHAPDAISAYLSAAYRSIGVARSVIEVDMRWSVDRLTTRLEELVREQSKRDLDGVRTLRNFVQARHPEGGISSPI